MRAIEKKLIEYADRFEDGFPTFQLRGKSDEKMIEMIDQCLDSGKDAYELGFVDDSDEVMY